MIMFLSVLSFLIRLTTAYDEPKYLYHFCSIQTTFTPKSAYEYNLNHLLSNLRSDRTGINKFSNGFYKDTTGQDPDKVYGLFLCRGDLTTETCQACVNFAISDITQRCRVDKETIIWYDECLLRYSNISIFSTMDKEPQAYFVNPKNDTQVGKISGQQVLTLMNEVINQALKTTKMFAVGKKNFTVFLTVYSLVQCTPDLSRSDCIDCLRQSIGKLVNCCTEEASGRMLYPSCNTRYELYPFFNESSIEAPTPTRTAAQTPTPRGGKGTKTAWIAIGTTVLTIIVFILLGSFIWYTRRRGKKERTTRKLNAMCLAEKKANQQELRWNERRIEDILRGETQGESQEFPIFPLDLALEATQHFSYENKLGEGGFGPVYKGILADGKEIAVKRLSRTSGQGLQEFKNEVTLIAKLQHKNLVRLLGCCLEGNELLLIYEYMPNKSLDFFLFDSIRSSQLDWKRRKSVINGIARGLLYLHEDSRLKVIHRDLKASNILLDHEMNPKISDFGMARIFGGNQDEANTNRVVGTYGYMAPEYAMEGVFSVKSDVFSFGVLLLEIISGKKNSKFYLSEHGQSLITYTWKLWCKGEALELMDTVLKQGCVPAELLKCIQIGLLCVQEDPANRPNMSSIAFMLASDTLILPQPTQPAYFMGRIVARSGQSSSSDIKICSVNEITFSDVLPR